MFKKFGLIELFMSVLTILATANLFYTGTVNANVEDNGRTVVSLSSRMAAVEANRFTSSDGLAVWQEIAKLKESIAKLPTEVPPKWFIDRVDKLENKLDHLSDSMAKHVQGEK